MAVKTFTCFLQSIDQINSALVSIRDIQKQKKNLAEFKLLNGSVVLG